MLYRQFGSTGWRVSAIGIGCRSVAKQWGIITEQMAEGIIRTAYASGINVFDATETYGDSVGTNEVRLGKALRGFRNKVYIAAKLRPVLQGMAGGSRDMEELIRTSFRLSSSRLNTDYIDILLCDSGSDITMEQYAGGLKLLKKEGLIREYGISTGNVLELKRFYEISEGCCRVVQLEYSLLERTPELDILPFCREKKLAVMVKSPLAKGLLSGKFDRASVFRDSLRKGWNSDGEARQYFERNLDKVNRIKAMLEDASDMTTTALRYVLSHETEPVAAPGVTSQEQVLKNVRAGLRLLTGNEIKVLRAVLD
ncbi:MAG: aldo/keto reductase [Bacillota bacterium]|nr:aldo/keto reductase [Bacillota bacterium]